MAQANINATITATDKASDVIDGVGKTIDQTSKSSKMSLKSVANASAVALGAVGAALTIYEKQATDFTANYVKESKVLGQQIGTTTEEASRLVAATKRVGISTEEASQFFGIFSKNIKNTTEDAEKNKLAQASLKNQIEKTKLEIKDTANEMKKSGDKTGELGVKLSGLQINLKELEEKLKSTSSPFEKLGISTQNASGQQKEFSQILFEVADKFKALPNGIDKTALSMELFGRSGKDMIKFLNLGSDGIKSLQQEADKLGLTLTPKTIGSIEKYIESQKRLKENTDALKITIGTMTAPVLAGFNEKLSSLIMKLIESDGPMKTFTVNVLAFGGPLASFAAGLLGIAANLGTVIQTAGDTGRAVSSLYATMIANGAAIAAWGAIAAAATAAAIAVAIEWSKTLDVINKTNNAIDSLKKSNQSAIDTVKKSMAEGKISVEEGQKKIKSLEQDMNSVNKSSFWDNLKHIPSNLVEGFKSLGRRAEGGPVNTNMPYVVGEKGPELFVPHTFGSIVPNHQMGTSSNVNINVSFSGVFTGSEMEFRKLATKVFAAYEDAQGMRGA